MAHRVLAQVPARQFPGISVTSVVHNYLKGLMNVKSRTYRTYSPLFTRQKKSEKPEYRDPYTIKQEEVRKTANRARSAETKARRAAIAGDPVRGTVNATLFVQSLDSAQDQTSGKTLGTSQYDIHEQSGVATASRTQAATKLTSGSAIPTTHSFNEVEGKESLSLPRAGRLNHFFVAENLRLSLRESRHLSSPHNTLDREAADVAREEVGKHKHDNKHVVRSEAVSRILAPENASSAQRTKINIQRCIDKFGRHHTDHLLKRQEDSGVWSRGQHSLERGGPDTGSSEVQVAILTAKLRVMMREFEGRGKNDKINKRNLRILLHKRQKLLKYLEKKDRGGPRWRHLIQTLGLTPAAWKGEINVR